MLYSPVLTFYRDHPYTDGRDSGSVILRRCRSNFVSKVINKESLREDQLTVSHTVSDRGAVGKAQTNKTPLPTKATSNFSEVRSPWGHYGPGQSLGVVVVQLFRRQVTSEAKLHRLETTHVSTPRMLKSPTVFHPDISVMVDWASKINYLFIYLCPLHFISEVQTPFQLSCARLKLPYS